MGVNIVEGLNDLDVVDSMILTEQIPVVMEEKVEI
jgi:hypothetical protein